MRWFLIHLFSSARVFFSFTYSSIFDVACDFVCSAPMKNDGTEEPMVIPQPNHIRKLANGKSNNWLNCYLRTTVIVVVPWTYAKNFFVDFCSNKNVFSYVWMHRINWTILHAIIHEVSTSVYVCQHWIEI